jgi:O-antigen/teichoic acid export membrane protein
VDLTRRLARGTAINAGGAAVGQLIELATVAAVLARVGTPAYGMVVLTIALLEWPAMLEPGPGQTVARLMAVAPGRRDAPTRGLLHAAVLAFAGVAAVTLALAASLTPVVIDGALDVPRAARGYAVDAYLLLVGAAAIRIAMSFVNRALIGEARLGALRAVDLLRVSATFGGVLLVGAEGWSALPAVGAAYLAGEALRAVAGCALLRRSLPDLVGMPTKQGFTDLWHASHPLLAANAVSVLSYRVDPLIAAVALGPTATAVYGVAHRVFEMVRGGADLLAIGVLPAASRLVQQGMGQGKRIRVLYTRTFRYLALCVWPVAATIAVFHVEIVRAWLREDLGGLGGPLVLAMVLVVLAVPGIVASPILIGADRVRTVVPIQVVAAPINLAIGIALVRPLGVSALFLGTITGTLIVTRRYVAEVDRLASDLGDATPNGATRLLFGTALTPALLVGALVALLLAARTVAPDGLAALLVAVGAAGGLYALAMFRWAVTPRELLDLFRRQSPAA